MWKLVALLLAGNGWMVQVTPIAAYTSLTGCTAGKAALLKGEAFLVTPASRILVCIPGQ